MDSLVLGWVWVSKSTGVLLLSKGSYKVFISWRIPYRADKHGWPHDAQWIDEEAEGIQLTKIDKCFVSERTMSEAIVNFVFPLYFSYGHVPLFYVYQYNLKGIHSTLKRYKIHLIEHNSPPTWINSTAISDRDVHCITRICSVCR